jgi:hypothetical protein
MFVLNEVLIDEDARTGGKWIDVRDGLQIKTRCIDYKPYREAMKKLMKPYKAKLRAGGEVPEDVQTKMVIKAYVDHILIDWKGFNIKDKNTGKIEAVPYSKEAAVKYLTMSQELLDDFLVVSGDRGNFRPDDLGDDDMDDEAANEVAEKN